MFRLCVALLLIFLADFGDSRVVFGQDRAAHDNPFLAADQTDFGWPSIRGPNHSGTSAEIRLADSWPDVGPPVLWVTELGQGYSSLVVKNNRVYTQYQSLAGQYVVCLDATNGKTIWQYRYDWPFQVTGLYPGPRSTPTIANGRIYFSTPLGAVGCLSAQGDLVWQQDLKTKYDGHGTGFGYACSPTVVDGKVIMPVGGVGASMVALDAENGDILWASGDASASYTPALPVTVDGHRQVIGYLQHDLVAFDLETGRQLWKQNLSHGYDEHSAWPIFSEPYLWTSAPFHAGSQLLRISGGENATFERVWQSQVMSNDVSSSVLVDGQLYGFDLAEAQSKAHRPSRGSFRAINFLSGDPSWSNGDPRIRRSTDEDENRMRQIIGHASLVAADGKLILLNDLGDLILAKIDSEKYVELARTPALKEEICWTSPSLDRGRVFLRNHARVVCIYVGDPKLINLVAGENLLTVADLPHGRVVDMASILGVEPEYAMDPPTHRWLRTWFLVSLAILGASGVLAALFSILAALCNRPFSCQSSRWLFWGVAMVLGLAVGTPASIAANDFVFTWPVTLFIAFQIAVYQSTLYRKKEPANRSTNLQNRFVAFAFLGICLAYFYVCRRLSLVTQWVFLGGFAAAIPFLLIGRALTARKTPVWLLAEFVLTVLAFTAFFGSTVIFLSLRYELSEF